MSKVTQEVRDFESTLVAPGSKVIVAVEKGNDRLAFDIQNIRAGRFVTAGLDTSLVHIKEPHMITFGGAVAELPYETPGFGYLVMEEENVYSLKGL